MNMFSSVRRKLHAQILNAYINELTTDNLTSLAQTRLAFDEALAGLYANGQTREISRLQQKVQDVVDDMTDEQIDRIAQALLEPIVTSLQEA